MRRFVTDTPLPKPINLKMNFTVNFQKTNTKDETPSPFHSSDLGAIKSNWQTNTAIKNSLDTLLRGMGIPITQIDLVNDQKLQLTISEKESASGADLMLFADAFHIAKFLIKNEAYAQGYDVGFVPTDGHLL